jgi:hypothetical protein
LRNRPRQSAPGGGLAQVTAAASKAAEQAARIAGALTLWADLHAEEVGLDAMADGIALAQFYLGEAAGPADAAAVSEQTDRAERLRRWLLGAWPHAEITSAEVVNKGPKALREAVKAHAALRILEAHGWLVPLEPGTAARGAPRKAAWRILRVTGA